MLFERLNMNVPITKKMLLLLHQLRVARLEHFLILFGFPQDPEERQKKLNHIRVLLFRNNHKKNRERVSVHIKYKNIRKRLELDALAAIDDTFLREEVEKHYPSLRGKSYTTQVSEWIEVDAIRSYERKPTIYYLGETGWQEVQNLLQADGRYIEKSELLADHDLGVNNILMRLLQQLPREDWSQVEWVPTFETRDQLFDLWKTIPKDQRRAKDRMISPDARIFLYGKTVWGEYDNASKSKAEIKYQYRNYIMSLIPIQNRDPVIWVVRGRRRKDNMIRWWEEVKQEDQFRNRPLPDFHFFNPGEETKFILEYASKGAKVC